MGKIFDYLDSRFVLKKPHKSFLERDLPANVNYFYCFGGITFILFLLLLSTGLMLSTYYVPSEKEAYQSIKFIDNKVYFGGVIRAVHKWSANLMVVCIVIHMLRVFVTGSYKKPRELNWVAGSVLLILTLGFGFTGYLLPWDQKAYWATVVGTSMAGTVPLIGKYLLILLRGGFDVNGITLLRFYSFHVLWLPLISLVFLWAHFHMIRQQGISGGL
ncbi:MAG: cytochrome b N-terminal domain-containing protein [Nitrospirae bacterium]|nr:cytochrome b N-terminal domain-containing protein [Nitrospirota bacterium]